MSLVLEVVLVLVLEFMMAATTVLEGVVVAGLVRSMVGIAERAGAPTPVALQTATAGRQVVVGTTASLPSSSGSVVLGFGKR